MTRASELIADPVGTPITNPISDLLLYFPQPGDPDQRIHPVIHLPAQLSPGFSLSVSSNGYYELSFSNGVGSGSNGGNATARVYLAAFNSAIANTVWTQTVSVPPNPGRVLIIVKLAFRPVNVSVAGTLWIGSWWDDGTYPDSQDGVLAYFAAHPEGGTHHTVPIILG